MKNSFVLELSHVLSKWNSFSQHILSIFTFQVSSNKYQVFSMFYRCFIGLGWFIDACLHHLSYLIWIFSKYICKDFLIISSLWIVIIVFKCIVIIFVIISFRGPLLRPCLHGIRSKWSWIHLDPIRFFPCFYTDLDQKIIAFTWDRIQVAPDNYACVFTTK